MDVSARVYAGEEQLIVTSEFAMPFTPFHIGPHACIAFPAAARLNGIVFIGANVIVDIEPLAVMLGHLDYPLHGYAHTLIVSAVLGGVWGMACYPLRSRISAMLHKVGLPAPDGRLSYFFSGLSGTWLHVLFDAIIYGEMRPLFPLSINPLYGLLSIDGLYLLCTLLFAPALGLYFFQRRRYRSLNNR